MISIDIHAPTPTFAAGNGVCRSFWKNRFGFGWI